MQIPQGDTYHILFTTRAFATGIPGTLSAATVAVYEEATATPIQTSVAVTEDYNSITGLNHVPIVATSGNGYDVGSYYSVVIEAGTVDSVSVVGEVVGHFRCMEPESAAGVPDVNIQSFDADSITAAAIAASAIDNATFAADVGSTAYATNIVALAVRKALDEIKLDHLVAIADADDPVDNSIIAKLANSGATADWSAYVNTTDSLMAIRDRGDAAWATVTGHATEAKQDTAQTDLDTITGTAGVLIGTDAANVTEISDAVWDEPLTGANHNDSTSAGRRLRSLNDFGLYEGGAVWYDDVNGAAGTTDFENGTVNNPSNAEASVTTLIASLGLTTIHMAPGSTYVLEATYANKVFLGDNWTLNLNGQSVVGCVFIGAAVSGAMAGTGTTQQFINCLMGATSLIKGTHLIGCGFGGTLTVIEAGDFFIDNCHSAVAGSGSVTFDFGGALTSSDLNIRHHSGGWTIANMGAGAGTYNASFEGDGQIVWAASCSATSNASIRGNWKITDQASGAVTETLDDNQTSVDAILVDTAEIGTAGAGLTNLGASGNDWNTVVPDAAGVAPTAAEVVNEWETQSQADPTGFHVNVLEIGGTAQTANDNGGDINAIKVITDALTAAAAANLALSAAGIIGGAAEAGTLSTTVMTTNLTGYANDELIGRTVIWTGGDADGQASDITGYASASGTVTYTAITTLPAAADTFVIV